MKVVSQHSTAFERQISEAVHIRRNAGPYLLNSRLEYNRCFIPTIYVKKNDNPEKEVDVKAEKESELVKKKNDLRSKWKKRERPRRQIDDPKTLLHTDHLCQEK